MSAPVSVTAVIAAAGSGERLGAGVPKAFVPLAGRPMLEWSVEALRASPSVAEIVIACPPGQLYEPVEGGGEPYEPVEGEPHGADAPRAAPAVRVIAGGATRSESVSNALAVVETELVAIHDAARPLLTPDLLEGVVATLAADPEAAGAIAAAPVTDTVKRVSDGTIEETLDREELWGAQTPQVFRVEALREALASPDAAATDEAMVVETAGGKVLIHPTEGANLKVTTALDLRVAELLLGER